MARLITSQVQSTLDELQRWFISEALRFETPEEAMSALCERMCDIGLPLQRMNLVVFLLHPLVSAMGIRWIEGELETHIYQHGLENAPTYRASPVLAMREGRITQLRRRLDGSDELDYPLLAELKSKGVTDYMMLPMRFSQGGTMPMSFASTQDGGFSTADTQLIEGMMPVMTMATEIIVQRAMTERLLETYLGKSTAHQVLSGKIKRGDGQNIESVIAMCDLRGFTQISDTHSRPELLELLDSYFEVVVTAIREHDGEILKFIGDAVLAVFPCTEESQGEACARAADAARAAKDAAARHNLERRDAGKLKINFGMALHIGDVMYGNIGSPDRLDFTVIGPAVNMASRIEGLCSRLDRPVLVSGAFARCYDKQLEPMGQHQLKGIEAPVHVFALPLASPAVVAD